MKPSVAEVVAVLDGLYDPRRADDWDAVGTAVGDPQSPVERVLFAVDPVRQVVAEAIDWGADLIVTHHPLLLRGVHGVATTTPKGRLVHDLVRAGIALHTCHTNADSPPGGVSASIAEAFGLTAVDPLDPDDTGSDRGSGRIGTLPEQTSLREFADTVVAALPATSSVARVAGDPDRPVRTVALCGGAGDFLLDHARRRGADVYVTSDLRHHPVSELREHPDAPAVIDVPHWAAEWTWLPVAARVLADRLAAQDATVETRVSRIVTDPWSMHVPWPEGHQA